MAEVNQAPVSKGIDALAQTLRQEGVEAGQLEADKLIAAAKEEASIIVSEARDKASQILGNARKEADFISQAGQQAFELAERNATLNLKSYLQEQFAEQIKATVGKALEDEALLKQMIVEVAGQNALADDEQVDVLLPAKVVGVSDLRTKPEELAEGTLMHFVAAEAAEMLREGVSFSVDEENGNDLVFRLKDKDIEVSLGSDTVSQMLLNHLQPRFRALLEGIVK
ncbi:hypothetical protein [Aliagarivorans marinus]|uniref:hypothetical protein n=1 Tax=Aliagarivorans marinus TaxID=561965 RepID=UPI00040689AC|nr:hypothetical protein [Aliagarivorans marinus]